MMWCSFDADPLILRLYGRGRAVRRQDVEWVELRRHFPALPGERQLIVLDIESVQTSCGYAVPKYAYHGERDTLARWAEKKGTMGLLDYWREKNQASIDGLPPLVENVRMKWPLIPLVLFVAACDPTPPPQPETEREPNPAFETQIQAVEKAARWNSRLRALRKRNASNWRRLRSPRHLSRSHPHMRAGPAAKLLSC